MPFDRTRASIRRMNEQTKDAAQQDVPAGNIKNQLRPGPLGQLPPQGNTGEGYTPADHDHTAAGDGGALTNPLHDGYDVFAEIAAPSAPAANTARLYAKDKAGITELFYKNSAGTEFDLSSTSATPLSDDDPEDIGATDPGVDTAASRADHVHALPDTAVTPATYGDSTHVAQFTVDQQGRITAAADVLISGGGSGLTWFNVMDYGAVGDGVTNDTTAVAAAVAALTSAGRGVLYFPAGSYSTVGGFTISVPCLVLGDGESGADTSGSTYSISKVTCSNTTAVLFLVTTGQCTFRNLSLEHIGAFLPTAGAGIRAAHASDQNARVNYENLTVRRFWINIDVQVGVAWSMRNCTIGDAEKYGVKIQNTILADAGDWMISDCVWADTLGADASLRLESSGGGKIVNCKFNGGGTKPARHIDLDASATSPDTVILLVSNCSFENYTGDAIHLLGPHWYLFAISNCQFGQYSNTTGHAIVADTLTDLIIDACVFLTFGSPASAISLTDVDRAYIGAITNNGFVAVLAQTSCTAIIDMSAGGGGSGAPLGASYVTLGTNGTLTDERVLTAGTGISITDGGAGSTVTIAATGGSYVYAPLTNGNPSAPELIFDSAGACIMA